MRYIKYSWTKARGSDMATSLTNDDPSDECIACRFGSGEPSAAGMSRNECTPSSRRARTRPCSSGDRRSLIAMLAGELYRDLRTRPWGVTSREGKRLCWTARRWKVPKVCGGEVLPLSIIGFVDSQLTSFESSGGSAIWLRHNRRKTPLGRWRLSTQFRTGRGRKACLMCCRRKSFAIHFPFCWLFIAPSQLHKHAGTGPRWVGDYLHAQVFDLLSPR